MLLPAYDTMLETTAVLTTVLQFLAGGVVCRKYIKKKSTGESSAFPFVCGFLSCCLWLRYGLLTNEHSVVLVNAIGAILFFAYSLIYYVFTVNKRSFIRLAIAIFLVLISIIVYTANVTDTATAVRNMGLICCVVTVCFFAAPLTMLLHVIKVKNAESLPFPLIAMSFLVSIQWLIYGIIISDTFLQIPNFLGCLLSLLQLSLFVCYPPRHFSGQGYKLVDQAVNIY